MRRHDSELLDLLRVVECDNRLWEPLATIKSNSRLALVQTILEAKSDTLRWVLEMDERPKKRPQIQINVKEHI